MPRCFPAVPKARMVPRYRPRTRLVGVPRSDHFKARYPKRFLRKDGERFDDSQFRLSGTIRKRLVSFSRHSLGIVLRRGTRTQRRHQSFAGRHIVCRHDYDGIPDLCERNPNCRRRLRYGRAFARKGRRRSRHPKRNR